MAYQPRVKPHKGSVHEYKKSFREKRRDKERIHRQRPAVEERSIQSEREISEGTLKRLHTLGIQKFGSSPFGEHFDRWMMNVAAVLDEFKSNPNIGVDEIFEKECAETIATIKKKLDGINHKEVLLGQELNKLSDWRSRLKQVNKEYASLIGAVKGQRNRETKRLNRMINQLKKDQDQIIQMKTGFFHGISKKKREQKEMDIIQEINDRQTELELMMLDFSAKQKELQADHEKKRDPVIEEIKKFRRIIKTMEIDGSLEERWFACETLVDAVNSFLQRKAARPTSSQSKNPL